MNRKEWYQDLDKWRNTCRKQKARYYGKTRKPRCKWTSEEIELLFNNHMTDTELSQKIPHSVGAIQVKRCILRKELKKP